MTNGLEIEIKIRSDDLNRLRDAGIELTLQTPRHFEDNWLLDNEAESLLRAGAALRVRTANGTGLVTFKGIVRESAGSPLKIREEVETAVSDPEETVRLFECLGFKRTFRYQKYRTIYSAEVDDGHVEVTFDETPMGNFIEIEGDEARVLKVLARVGYTAQDSVRESYPELQLARCREKGIPLEDLVFQIGHAAGTESK